MTFDDWTRRAERREPLLRRGVWAVLIAGLLAFVVRGADQPADPYLAAVSRQPLAGFSEIAFRITTPAGHSIDWCALLAATARAREQGLMHQRDLRGYDGMIFQFDAPSTGSFYMFHTALTLSIAWFDAQGRFISEADMRPCRATDGTKCPTFPAGRPYLRAIEVDQGGLARLGVRPGSSLVLAGRCH